MISVENKIVRGISRKINEMNIPNQRPNIEYVSNEFKKSLPIAISNRKQLCEEAIPEPASASSSPSEGFLKHLKGRLNTYYQ
jgi:hypothetical protein